jgi:hypothetical protein
VASVKGCAVCEADAGEGFRVVWVEGKDLEVHVCVCDEEGEGFGGGVREEVAGESFEAVFGAPKEEHLVGLFLWGY